MTSDEDMLPMGTGDLAVGRVLTKTAVRAHILAALGMGVFKVELSNEHLDQAILHALRKYGKRIPITEYFGFQVAPGVNRYPLPEEVKYSNGIYAVEFIDQSTSPASLYFYDLLNPAPLKPNMLQDIELFYRWRATFARVLSIEPHWEYIQAENVLMISSPAISFNACAFIHRMRKLSEVKANHQDWVLEYATAKAKAMLAEVRGKFAGTLPGGGRDLTLNADRLAADAKEELARLEEVLLGWQGDTPVGLA